MPRGDRTAPAHGGPEGNDPRRRGRLRRLERGLGASAIVFGVALVASTAAHLEAYGTLGVLADALDASDTARRTQTETDAEVEFVVVDVPAPREEALDEPERPEEARRRPARADDPVARRESPSTVEPPPVVVPPTPPTPPEPPPPPPQNLQAVRTRSAEPDVPPPPDARYLARENSRVEEETAARVTNYQRDDAETVLAAAERTQPSDAEGNAADDEVADMREAAGDTSRDATAREVELERPAAPDVASDAPPTAARERGAPLDQPTEQPGSERANDDAREAVAAAEARPEAPEASETIVVDDGFGTFEIRRPRGEAAAGREGRAGVSARGRRGAARTNLGVSWSSFEAAVGDERLERERQAYAAERRSRRQGSSREAEWREFRSAIENFLPDVRPGNQTALRTAASPFADYLADVHRRIHRHFADRFLASLPAVGTSEMADPTLMTELEIVLNRDGSVHRVGVVRTSGFLPFDYGAFAAVMRGQPYPDAPPEILSGDSRVYFHWGFYRNERQCGTFNASPYILPDPPSSSRTRHDSTLRDGPDYGSTVPRGAAPAYRPAGPREEGAPRGDDAPAESPTPSRPAGPARPALDSEPSAPRLPSPPPPRGAVIG